MKKIGRPLIDEKDPTLTQVGEGDRELDIEFVAKSSVAAPAEEFEINFDRMREQGFFTPTQEEPVRLALELRAIKRRLLRRLDFQRRGRKRKKTNSPDNGRPSNIILTTSTRPEEGKTFTSINLAMSFAIEDNIGTVLVDADKPRPKVLSHFGLEPSPGLTDLIAGESQLHVRECLRREKNYPLAILSEGMSDERSLDLYSRDEAQSFFHDLSVRFPDRLIIVDAPPILATPEALILAPYVDEIVFVVEANKTPEPAVAAALEELLDVNERISMILNRCTIAENVVHYGSYDEYYGRDGRTDD